MTDHDHQHDDHQHDLFDRGLQYDMSTLLARRHLLGLLAGAGLATLSGCSNSSGDSAATASPTGSASAAATSATTASAAAATTGTCTEIPEETAGPYPGDGSNGPDVLSQSGVVRSDIRSSFGSSTTTAQGVPMTIKLTIQDQSNGCAPLSGAAVYVWHCDRDGNYSMYSQSITDENYLRGVQATDGSGLVTFTSIFPACYSGRWPHIHFEVYPSVAKATSVSNKVATSQVALPQDVCEAVYATSGYSQSVKNLAQVSLKTDNVFGDDGGVHQLATVTGSVADGYTVALTVPV